jgi:anti-sigma factor ChrR (cupin superfamily)
MSVPKPDNSPSLHSPTLEQQESAALAALDLASPSEAASAPRQLVNGMRAAAWLLAEGVPPATPSASLKSRLLARVAQYEQLKPLADVRRNEEHWVSIGTPGVDIKPLFKEDATGRSTYLVRMQPGSHLAAHRHHDAEQCLVLKGDIRWGDLVYEEGDFVVMGTGTEHPEIHTVGGTLMLIVSGRNELLHA